MLIGIPERIGAKLVTTETVKGKKEGPDVTENVEERGHRGGGGSCTRYSTEAIAPTPNGLPRAGDPKGTTAIEEGQKTRGEKGPCLRFG